MIKYGNIDLTTIITRRILALVFLIHNKQQPRREWYQGQCKKTFLVIPVNSTLVRKDGVSPISFCDYVFVIKFSVPIETTFTTHSETPEGF